MRHTLLFIIALLMLSCQSWGEWDEPAGNQKNPDRSTKLMASFPFKLDFLEESSEQSGEGVAYNGGTPPFLEGDPARGDVLYLSDGYVRIPNPLKDVTADVGATFKFWFKAEDLNRALFSFSHDELGRFQFKGNTEFTFSGPEQLVVNDASKTSIDFITESEWYYIGVVLTKTDFTIYLNGEKVFDKNSVLNMSNEQFDFSQITDLIKAADYIYLGDNTATNSSDLFFSKLKIYRNALPANDFEPDEDVTQVALPVYFNSFEGPNDAVIQGAGAFVAADDPRFGTVFRNATGGMRENYLLLPEHVLSHSAETKAMSIAVWVNAKHAGGSTAYGWSPLFTAYGSEPASDGNLWPMLALQYRGLLQVNCAGWCDFTDAQNVAGMNTMYHFATDWLADNEWHYYTATFTETSCKVFFDGELKNEWQLSGEDGQTVTGLFSNGYELKHICLGGNQAWNWGDPDPGFMFDDFAIYDIALTPQEIEFIMSNK